MRSEFVIDPEGEGYYRWMVSFSPSGESLDLFSLRKRLPHQLMFDFFPFQFHTFITVLLSLIGCLTVRARYELKR